MRQFIVFSLSIFFIVPIFSQIENSENSIDSLDRVIQSNISNVDKLESYKQLTLKLIDIDSTRAEKSITAAIDLSIKMQDLESEFLFKIYRAILCSKSNCTKSKDIVEEILEHPMLNQFPIIEANGMYLLGLCAYNEDDFDNALVYYKKCADLFQNLSNKANAYCPYRYIGIIYFFKREFKEAIHYAEKYSEYQELIKDTNGLAKAYELLAAIHGRQGGKEKAITYGEKSLQIHKLRKDDKAMAMAHFNLASSQGLNGNLTAALFHLTESVELHENLGFEYMRTKGLESIAYVHLKLGEEEKASIYFDKVVENYTKNSSWNDLRISYISMGSWYSTQGDYTKAMGFYNEAMEIAQKNDDPYKVGIILGKISKLYSKQNNIEQAIHFQELAIEQFEANNSKSEKIAAILEMAKLFILKKQYEKAITQSKIALEGFMSFQDSCFVGETYKVISEAYQGKGDNKIAERNINFAIPILDKCNRFESLSSLYISLAGLNINESIDNKIKYCEAALDYSILAKDIHSIKNASLPLHDLYSKKGMYKKAYSTLNLYQENIKKLFNEENTKELVQIQLEHKYETEKQKQDLIQKSILERQKYVLYFVLLMSLALLGFAYTIWKNYKIKKEANEKLSVQNLEITRQKEELEKIDEIKSQFFANISHELRTPLTLISGPIQQIISERHQILTPSLEKNLSIVERNTNDLKELVDDIMDLSKLEADKMELNYDMIEIRPFLIEIFKNFEKLAVELKIKFIKEIDIKPNTHISVDSKKLKKIIENLLSNAIKHTPTNGTIVFRVESHESVLDLYVIDDGEGISEKELPYIFDRFYQGTKNNNKLQQGSGIGLALSKELANLLGGELKVNSTQGIGSEFNLYIPFKSIQEVPLGNNTPILNEAIKLRDEESKSISDMSSSRNTILIVDDNKDIQYYIQTLLEKKYDTLIANNGKEAINIMQKLPVDMIISDVMMPEMDGYQLLENIKSDPNNKLLPVIMLTALHDNSSKLKALTLGVDDYLHKPFLVEELYARIRNLLERYKIRKQINTEVKDELTEVIKDNLESDVWVKQVEQIIRAELENPDFNISALAKTLHLSERQFQRRMKQATGLAPKKFYIEVCLQKARELIEEGTYHTVKAVSLSVGFSNVWRFSQLYEERFGKSPLKDKEVTQK